MLCKLFSCRSPATERRRTPFGTSNMCVGHAVIFDGWISSNGSSALEKQVLDGLAFAHRYGPPEDPALEQFARGPDYAHPRDGSE